MTIELIDAKDVGELRNTLIAITDENVLMTAAILFLSHFELVEKVGPEDFPTGFTDISDHAALPEAFPDINPRPAMFMGVILNPNSPEAKAYDPSKPSLRGCRRIPLGPPDEAWRAIEARLGDFGL